MHERQQVKAKSKKVTIPPLRLRGGCGDEDSDNDDDGKDVKESNEATLKKKPMEPTRKSVREKKTRRDSFLVNYAEACSASDSGSDDVEPAKKKRKTDFESHVVVPQTSESQLSPEIQRMMTKLNVATADCTKQKQRLDITGAGLAIHRWARKKHFSLMDNQLSDKHFKEVLASYGRQGGGLLITSSQSLRKCWLREYCDTKSKLHIECYLCQEKTWDNFQEEAIAEDGNTDNAEKHSDEEQDIAGEEYRAETVDKEIQTESFSGDTGVSINVAQIQKSLIEMAAELKHKEVEIMQLKEELRAFKKSEEVKVTSISLKDLSDEEKHKCHICEAKYLNYVTLVRHYKNTHPNVNTSDIPKEEKQLKFECAICGKKFGDKQILVYHHNNVHKKPRCQYCNQEQTHLKRHEKVCVKKGTSGAKKTQCPRCSREVVKLTRHLKTCKDKGQPKPPSQKHSENLFEGQTFAGASQVDFLALSEQADIERLANVTKMVNDMEETSVKIASRLNISLTRGVRSAAGGQCLFESASDQILNRVLWLTQAEDEEENPLMFQEVIDALGIENLSAQSIREGTVDLLKDNEDAFNKFNLGPEGDFVTDEVRREEFNRQLEELRKEGQYAMQAGDLMGDGVSALLGLYIVLFRASTPDNHPIHVHSPLTFGGTVRQEMPLLLVFDETHSHYEEGRPADMASDQNLIFVKEIFLEHDYWPYRYEEKGSEPKKDEVAPTPKRKKLFSTKCPSVPEVFSPEEDGESSNVRTAGKSSCKPQDKVKKRDRSPSPNGDQTGSNLAPTSIPQERQVSESAANIPDKMSADDSGTSRKMKKYEDELKKILSSSEQDILLQFRDQLNQTVDNLPAFMEELKRARLGNDTIFKLVSDYKDSNTGMELMTDLQRRRSGVKEPSTLKHWLHQLKSKILPFLHHKYPGIDLNILIDFKEEIEHDNYHRSDPPTTKKLFMLSETDIKESLNSTYNYLPNSGSSKHQLVMAWQALFRAIAKHAKSNKNLFNDWMDAQYTISNYEDAADVAAGAIKLFKAQAAEKKADDELKGKSHPQNAELTRGVHKWYNSEQRELYRKTLAELADAKAVPSQSQYIQCEEYLHTEMIVSSPFRNAVWKNFPYRALAEAYRNPGWDPSDVSDRDEGTVETVTEDGFTFRQTADISRPPPSRACEHQKTNPNCDCPDACAPCGYNVLLTWDKGNTQATKNRHLHLPTELWELIMQFARIRDRYFSCILPKGPTGKESTDWFKGHCPLLLNSAGKQNNAFTMSMASRIMEMDVTPHMFRKLFCTFLAHHKDEAVRGAQSQVCGQSTSIFQQYYNLNKRKDAQTLVQLCQNWPSDNEVPSDSSNKWDEENQQRLLEELKRIEDLEEEVDQVRELIDTHSFKNPIMKEHLSMMLKIATRIDRDIIASHPNFELNGKEFLDIVRLTQEPWKKRFLKLAMQDSTTGQNMRHLLHEIFRGREEPTRHKWSVVETMVERQENAKAKGKHEPQLWDPLWVLLDTIFSSVTAKLKNLKSSSSEDPLYKECTCDTLPNTFACVHCKKPICNRCCR